MAWLLGLVVVAAPIAAIAFFVLAVAGSPGSCEAEGQAVVFTPGQAGSFQEKWDQFDAAVAAGPGSTVVFSESEVTSRARFWIDEHDVPVSEFLVCINAEGPAASGKVDVPFFPGDIDVLIRGTLDLRGEHPKAVIEEFEIGGLPGPVAEMVEELVEKLIDDQTVQIDLKHDYHATFGEGEVTITGQR